MKHIGKIIPIDRPTRLLQKAHAYLSDMDFFLSDSEKAIAVLLDSLPYADTELLLKMLPLIGCAGRDSVLWPLYRLMNEPSLEEHVRRAVAIQLALAASLSDDPSALQKRLIAKLNHEEPTFRSSCALALGWEGNLSAVEALMMHLQDPDREVQAAVVAALSSVGDIRVLNALIGRLKTGTIEEQRSILLNLWRFEEQTLRVENTYLGCLAQGSPDMRRDALSALAMIPFSTAVLEAYRRLLVDEDPRIRYQVLENLSILDPTDYNGLADNLKALLSDEDLQVRRAAVRLFARR